MAKPSSVTQKADSNGPEMNVREEPDDKSNSEMNNLSKESTLSVGKNVRKENMEDKEIKMTMCGDSSVSSGLPDGINSENNGTAKKEPKQMKRETPSRRCKITKKSTSNNSVTGRDAT